MKKFAHFQKRKRKTHKGDFGHLLILAGSLGMTGAACLASEAALRSGCGLATLGIPESLNVIVEKKLTEVMTKPLPQTKQKTLSKKALLKIITLLSKKDAVAIGPGLSQNKQTREVILKLLPKIQIPMVLDADALNFLATDVSVLKKIKVPVVITPHSGEMSRLIGAGVKNIQKNRKTVAKTAAKKYNITVVLKGHNTVVAHSKYNVYVNKTGNPGMATAGSGDVLTGIIGSLLAQGIEAFKAAKIGVYLHGLAGDLAAKDFGEASLVASDILNKIPQAIKSSQRSSVGRAAVL